MLAVDAALDCARSIACSGLVPGICRAKSMIVVVPPWAAERVPEAKLSAVTEGPKVFSMCVWQSTPPGNTSMPAASITRVSLLAGSWRPMATICSPSTRMSAT